MLGKNKINEILFSENRSGKIYQKLAIFSKVELKKLF